MTGPTSYHCNPNLMTQPGISVCHMNRCSFMTGVDQFDWALDHRIKDGHDVIARKRKYRINCVFLKRIDQ
jgi:hypothetical protein